MKAFLLEQIRDPVTKVASLDELTKLTDPNNRIKSQVRIFTTVTAVDLPLVNVPSKQLLRSLATLNLKILRNSEISKFLEMNWLNLANFMPLLEILPNPKWNRVLMYYLKIKLKIGLTVHFMAIWPIEINSKRFELNDPRWPPTLMFYSVGRWTMCSIGSWNNIQ